MIEELINKFNSLSAESADLSGPIKWKDAEGFSLLEDYDDGFASLYKIGIRNPESEKDLKEMIVTVSYGKKDISGSISVGSGQQGLRDPIDLIFDKEFFYDISSKKIFYHKKPVSAKELLLRIRKKHKRPTKTIKGFPLRTRLWFWRKLMPGILKVSDKVFQFLLLIISGDRVIEKDISSRYFDNKFRRKEKLDEGEGSMVFKVELNAGNSMTFFGYTTKKRPVAIYSALHLLAYAIFYNFNIESLFLSTVLKNNFLALCYVALSFGIIESIPYILESLIKWTTKSYGPILFKRLKI